MSVWIIMYGALALSLVSLLIVGYCMTMVTFEYARDAYRERKARRATSSQGVTGE